MSIKEDSLRLKRACSSERTASEFMTPGNDEMPGSRNEKGYREHWFTPVRCSICTSLIWFASILLIEPPEAPEPHHQWMLCKPCHEALLVELSRSTIRSPLRLRVAVGLVASERFPHSTVSTRGREQSEFQREFTWVIRLMVLFALLHLIIFVIIFAIPK